MRFASVTDAQTAIAALDGTTVLGHKLQVKFADADAGPPAAAAPSGLTPSDSCYAKHLPASWGVSVGGGGPGLLRANGWEGGWEVSRAGRAHAAGAGGELLPPCGVLPPRAPTPSPSPTSAPAPLPPHPAGARGAAAV